MLRLPYEDQWGNVYVQRNIYCLLWESHGTRIYTCTVLAKRRVLIAKAWGKMKTCQSVLKS
jgi:hypothetical protein